MSLDRLKEKVIQIQSRIPVMRGRGEEATKQALVLPMLDALGYDIWNPIEVCPEFEADFALKKQGQREKVDLAVVVADQPRIFIEVKAADTPLDGHEGQLGRYFNGVPSVSLGVLTNGAEYRFYTDTGEPNLLDPLPFFTLRLESADLGLDVLSRFHKSVFAPNAIRDFATELNYTSRITSFLRGELDLRSREPSDSFVRWVLANEGMYEGRLTAGVIERFRSIVKNGLHNVLREVVRRSVAALDDGVVAPEATLRPLDPVPTPAAASCAVEVSELPKATPPIRECATSADDLLAEPPAGSRAVTTEKELQAFAIIKAQFGNSALAAGTIHDATQRKDVPIELSYKDTTGYFGVYFNKPSWWFARLYLDGRTPWIGVNLDAETATRLLPAGTQLLAPGAFAAVRVPVPTLNDLLALNQLIYAAMQRTVDERRQRTTAE